MTDLIGLFGIKGSFRKIAASKIRSFSTQWAETGLSLRGALRSATRDGAAARDDRANGC
jgi:hypothetical protein